MKNYSAGSLQKSPVLSQISQSYPKFYNHFEDRFSRYSEEISQAENVQDVADLVARRVDQSMQPTYVGGRVLRNVYDYFFSQTKSQELADLSSISGDTISAAQLQSFIDSKRNQSADGYVDLSPLSGLKLQGQSLEVPVDDDDDRISDVDLSEIQVFSGLNVSRTNFPEIFSMNSSYFYNSDFFQNRFGNMADVFFDGCNLHRANMSQTTQTNLYFAGVSSYFLVDEIQKINGYLEYPDVYFRDPLTVSSPLSNGTDSGNFNLNKLKFKKLDFSQFKIQYRYINKEDLWFKFYMHAPIKPKGLRLPFEKKFNNLKRASMSWQMSSE